MPGGRQRHFGERRENQRWFRHDSVFRQMRARTFERVTLPKFRRLADIGWRFAGWENLRGLNLGRRGFVQREFCVAGILAAAGEAGRRRRQDLFSGSGISGTG